VTMDILYIDVKNRRRSSPVPKRFHYAIVQQYLPFRNDHMAMEESQPEMALEVVFYNNYIEFFKSIG
jgi:hypothetical protein